MSWRLGVDSGGTFTDVCLFDEDSGRVEVWKVSSTPDDPSRGIAEGVEQGMETVESTPSSISFLGHGTTVGTNALIQLRGVRTGLITTEGFRDLLEVGRQKRPDLYDLDADKPPLLVPRDLRIDVKERVRFDGTVEIELDEEAVRLAARRLKTQAVQSVAVSFLYGFLRPEHERAALHIIAEEFPDAFLCASHDVAPEFREYERTSTTVVNAYLGPIMKRYIDRLGGRLKQLDLKVEPQLTQSNGGVIGFETAAALPVRTVLSGPSTGVVAAQEIGKASGLANLITFDMGGTSSDVALLVDGRCRLASEATVHGYPIKAPMLDIHTVGAGGGSIAYVDSGGLLKVGPRSAGASPGPACYGKGNDEPTVTDANVVLQTLNPTHLLGGRMPIDRSLSKIAIARVAEQLGLDMLSTAAGILAVVTANMARAIRVISVQRGYDPRDYTLTSFGGAGPLHAARLARELDMRRILVPRNPGILCAMGLLLTDLRADFARTKLVTLEPGAEKEISAAFDAIDRQAETWFDAEGVAPASRQTARRIDMRYAGQNYELAIPLRNGFVDSASLTQLARDFAEAHRRAYGFVADKDPIQLVTYRIEAAGAVRKAELKPRPEGDADATNAIIDKRDVYFPETGSFISCPIYARDRLDAGHRFSGPAIVEQMDATTVILPGMNARVDRLLNLIIEDT